MVKAHGPSRRVLEEEPTPRRLSGDTGRARQGARDALAQAIRRALSREVQGRFPSAQALARALEDVTHRVSGIEEAQPCPGLASFTETGAESFFGREGEGMWKRLPRRHLVALVGPSGAGKSSFLHAGLIPAKPERWAPLVTGDADGVVRVGPLSGEEPHLFYGHTGPVTGVAVSPDGLRIASGSDDGTFRLWDMPDLARPPLHTLPHGELLARLRSHANLRAVRDPASDAGWKVEGGPFPGWATVPDWAP